MMLREAIHQRIARLRLPNWAEPDCYAKLHLLPTGDGPLDPADQP